MMKMSMRGTNGKHYIERLKEATQSDLGLNTNIPAIEYH